MMPRASPNRVPDVPQAEVGWDAFAERCQGGDLVQTSGWAKSKQAQGLRTLLAVVHDGAGDVVGGAPIVAKRIAPALSVGYVARGPLLLGGSAADAGLVVDRVLTTALAAGVRLIIVQPPEGADAVEHALVERRFETGVPSVAPEATIRLDLTRTDDELLADMTKTRRRDLTRAVPATLEIETGDNIELFQRLHAATAARQGFVPLSLTSLRGEWDALAPSGYCGILVARQHGVPVSALWYTSFAGTRTYKLAGWDADASARLGAPRNMNDLLHWENIRRARASGAHTLDLGGVERGIAERLAAGDPLPEDFVRTPDYFKRRFGGTVVLLPVARWAILGSVAAAVGRPAVRRILADPRIGRAAHRLRAGARR
jgi:hypothetical protein